MKNFFLKPFDRIIIACLLLFSLFSFFLLMIQKQAQSSSQQKLVEIIHEKTIIQKFPLEKNRTWKFQDKNGHENVIEINNQKIHIKTANCPDKTCAHHPLIHKAGETILCVPHRLIIRIRSNSPKEEQHEELLH